MSVGKPSPGELNAHQSTPRRTFRMNSATAAANDWLRLGGIIYVCPLHWHSEFSGFFGTSGSGIREKAEETSALHWHNLFHHRRCVGFPALLLCATLPAAVLPTLLFPPCCLTRTTESAWIHRKPFFLSLQVTISYTSMAGMGSIFYFPSSFSICDLKQ